MDKVYNKLVRDNIPSIIENDGCKCVTKVLNEKEYKVELYKKLQEETNGGVIGSIKMKGNMNFK